MAAAHLCGLSVRALLTAVESSAEGRGGDISMGNVCGCEDLGIGSLKKSEQPANPSVILSTLLSNLPLPPPDHSWRELVPQNQLANIARCTEQAQPPNSQPSYHGKGSSSRSKGVAPASTGKSSVGMLTLITLPYHPVWTLLCLYLDAGSHPRVPSG